ncbi:hypothetical protein PVL29_021835 [Vitis rotundifolia]|uniref:Myb-like domain-containing protein n=1 Tax=Vitis rotundifolia TaxID=103349 RepID=A0AA38YTP7_VITRO|nr:hypothetical protein PVL29_021835 [Vitis rotundifolia]
MAPEHSDVHENAVGVGVGVSNGIDGGDDKNKVARHPRWTRQETFVLIQGKKIAENRVRRGRRSSSAFGSDQVEPKWDSVSSYCRRHGVNRGPVQCRKRWSNLVGDFKKIKTWESEVREDAESFWVLRNDLRRERKLPGFFDREVYDVLDGRAFSATAFPLALVSAMPDVKSSDGMEPVAVAVEAEEEEGEEEEEEEEAVFDSGRQAAAEDGLFSDSEQLGQEEASGSLEKETTAATESPTQTTPIPLPISERKFQKFYQGCTSQGKQKGKQPCSDAWTGSMSEERWKRRRVSVDECAETNMEEQLIKVLERNSKMLTAQLEAQNVNSQLDRDQRKDHANSLVAALSKLTDAIVRIADKL